jgi:Endoplasmic Reticulum Oxidoreductin 1 (ERO1)/FAD binding domain
LFCEPISAQSLRSQFVMQRLLDSHILTSCSSVFDAFDESLMFQDEFHNITTLKRQFKGIFQVGSKVLRYQSVIVSCIGVKFGFGGPQNISRVLDCVSCEKCKLHGKVALLGLGTALRVLLLPEHMIQLSREEVVAFVNTLGKFANAIHWAGRLADLYNAKIAWSSPTAQSFSVLGINPKLDRISDPDVGGPPERMKPRVDPRMDPAGMPPARMSDLNQPTASPRASTPVDRTAVEAAVELVAKLGAKGLISAAQEDALIDGALRGNVALFSLVANFGSRPEVFLRHALRNLDVLATGSIPSAPKAFPSQPQPVQQEQQLGISQPDTIIIGSGLAGMTAAIDLIDKGRSVIIVEKENFLGGNSGKASSGINGVDPDPSKQAELHDSEALFERDILTGDGESSDFRSETNSTNHVHTLATRSGSAVVWLRDRFVCLCGVCCRSLETPVVVLLVSG